MPAVARPEANLCATCGLLPADILSAHAPFLQVHNLGPGRPIWLDWDCNGSSVALMQVRKERTRMPHFSAPRCHALRPERRVPMAHVERELGVSAAAHSVDLSPIDPTHRSQEGVGIYLWDVLSDANAGVSSPSQPLRLAPSITSATSFCAWSKKFLQLAIGTEAGKVCADMWPRSFGTCARACMAACRPDRRRREHIRLFLSVST